MIITMKMNTKYVVQILARRYSLCSCSVILRISREHFKFQLLLRRPACLLCLLHHRNCSGHQIKKNLKLQFFVKLTILVSLCSQSAEQIAVADPGGGGGGGGGAQRARAPPPPPRVPPYVYTYMYEYVYANSNICKRSAKI